MENFIGISREIRKHWIYQDNDYFKVWFEMLCCARFLHEPLKDLIEGQFVELNYGEFMYGRTKWSERLKVSERRLRTLIDKMVNDGMIEVVNKYPKFTVYRITNYSKYNHQNDQQKSLLQQGFAEHDDHLSDQQATSRRPAGDQHMTTKEDSKDINSFAQEEEGLMMTPLEAYRFAFKQYNYTGYIQGYVVELLKRGFTDAFVRELFLEMGTRGIGPDERYMRKMAEDWISRGIYTRVESQRRRAEEKNRQTKESTPSEREAKIQQKRAEERKLADVIPMDLKPEFEAMREVAVGYES